MAKSQYFFLIPFFIVHSTLSFPQDSQKPHKRQIDIGRNNHGDIINSGSHNKNYYIHHPQTLTPPPVTTHSPYQAPQTSIFLLQQSRFKRGVHIAGSSYGDISGVANNMEVHGPGVHIAHDNWGDIEDSGNNNVRYGTQGPILIDRDNYGQIRNSGNNNTNYHYSPSLRNKRQITIGGRGSTVHNTGDISNSGSGNKHYHYYGQIPYPTNSQATATSQTSGGTTSAQATAGNVDVNQLKSLVQNMLSNRRKKRQVTIGGPGSKVHNAGNVINSGNNNQHWYYGGGGTYPDYPTTQPANRVSAQASSGKSSASPSASAIDQIKNLIQGMRNNRKKRQITIGGAGSKVQNTGKIIDSGNNNEHHFYPSSPIYGAPGQHPAMAVAYGQSASASGPSMAHAQVSQASNSEAVSQETLVKQVSRLLNQRGKRQVTIGGSGSKVWNTGSVQGSGNSNYHHHYYPTNAMTNNGQQQQNRTPQLGTTGPVSPLDQLKEAVANARVEDRTKN